MDAPLAMAHRAALRQHARWWDTVWAQRLAAGDPVSVTPEYGPPPYAPAGVDEAALESLVLEQVKRVTPRVCCATSYPPPVTRCRLRGNASSV